MGGGEKPRLSQAEKKRLRAEKLAADDEARAARKSGLKAALRPSMPAMMHTPEWLQTLVAGFRSCAEEIESRSDDDQIRETLLQRCRFHEEKLTNIVKLIESATVTPDSLDEQRDSLEYLLELLVGGDVEESANADDETLYADISLDPPQGQVSTEPEPSAGPSLSSPASEVHEALRALDFAETTDEIRLAMLNARPLRDESAAVGAALNAAAERLARLKLEAAENHDRQPVAERPRPAEPREKAAAAPTAGGDQISRAAAAQKVKTGGHTTHCEGVKRMLLILEARASVKGVMAGPLSTVESHAEEFRLTLQRGGELSNGAFKLVARKGRQAQDIYLTLSAQLMSLAGAGGQSVEELAQNAIDEALAIFHRRRGAAADEEDETELIAMGGRNLSGAEAREVQRGLAQAKHKQKHDEAGQRDAAARRQEKEKEKERKFKSSKAARESGFDMKTAAKEWVGMEEGEVKLGRQSAFGGRSKRIDQHRVD